MSAERSAAGGWSMTRRGFGQWVAAETATLSVASLGMRDILLRIDRSPKEFTRGFGSITEAEFMGAIAEAPLNHTIEGSTVRFALSEPGMALHRLRIPYLPQPRDTDTPQAALHVWRAILDEGKPGERRYIVPIMQPTASLTKESPLATLLTGALKKGEHTLRFIPDTPGVLPPLPYDITTPILRHGLVTKFYEHNPVFNVRPDTVRDHFLNDTPLMVAGAIKKNSKPGESDFTEYEFSLVLASEEGGDSDLKRAKIWGRTFDITLANRIKLDETGEIIDEDFEGPFHIRTRFHGEKLGGRHSVLYIATKNNLVQDFGRNTWLFSPIPVFLPKGWDIERFMHDRYPQVQEISRLELLREHRYTNALRRVLQSNRH